MYFSVVKHLKILCLHRYLTASIKPNAGDPLARLEGNTTIPFQDGWANYTDLNISHNATGYVLQFSVTSPSQASFSSVSQPFDVKERILYFILSQRPIGGNETVPFDQQPVVEVYDAADGSLVTNTGWKGRRWSCTAVLHNPNSLQGTHRVNNRQFLEFACIS